jgi:hypothetical protein
MNRSPHAPDILVGFVGQGSVFHVAILDIVDYLMRKSSLFFLCHINDILKFVAVCSLMPSRRIVGRISVLRLSLLPKLSPNLGSPTERKIVQLLYGIRSHRYPIVAHN